MVAPCEQTSYAIVVVTPKDSARPDDVRLRRLMKEMGRRHGLRVVDVRVVQSATLPLKSAG